MALVVVGGALSLMLRLVAEFWSLLHLHRAKIFCRCFFPPVPVEFPVPDLQLPGISPNSGPRMFLLSSNFLFAFGFDSVPPRLWEV